MIEPSVIQHTLNEIFHQTFNLNAIKKILEGFAEIEKNICTSMLEDVRKFNEDSAGLAADIKEAEQKLNHTTTAYKGNNKNLVHTMPSEIQQRFKNQTAPNT